MSDASEKTAFTPGPWLLTDDGLMVYALHHNGDYHKGQPFLVNRMSSRIEPYTNQGGSLDEAQANARLIAAAPDLYAALLRTRTLVSKCAMNGFVDEADIVALFKNNGAISAALAKARGDS